MWKDLLEDPFSMFGLVGYLMMCFAVSCVFTVLVAMFRPIKQQDDWKAWRVILGSMIVVGSLPYGYVEAMTASHGQLLKHGVQESIDEAELNGRLQFFKVLFANEKVAHVIAVASDKNEFGLPERVVMDVNLKAGKDGWHSDSYSIVSSFKRQRDATTMPPYW